MFIKNSSWSFSSDADSRGVQRRCVELQGLLGGIPIDTHLLWLHGLLEATGWKKMCSLRRVLWDCSGPQWCLNHYFRKSACTEISRIFLTCCLLGAYTSIHFNTHLFAKTCYQGKTFIIPDDCQVNGWNSPVTLPLAIAFCIWTPTVLSPWRAI